MGKNKKQAKSLKETDSTYFLKMVVYLVLGSQWLRLTKASFSLPLPLGLLIGLMFSSKDRFRIDRKIEYVLLLVAAFVGFWLPIGLQVSIM